jgi:hypothetical protein
MRIKQLAAATALAALALVMAVTAAFALPPQSSQPFYFLDPDHAQGDPVPGASASLARTPNGVHVWINTNDLDPGAYTVWWVVWNDPSECTGGCGEDDLGAPGNLVGFATGGVVGMAGIGGFGGSLRTGVEGEPGETLLISNGGLGLTDPTGAEVHMVIRYHGPVVAGEMPGQIGSFAGGCTPASSLDLGDGDFDCVDMQAVVFAP